MTTDREDDTSSDADDARVREFYDDENRRWTVCEQDVPYADNRGGKCLVFFGDDTARRVRNYPPNWFGLSDAGLYELANRS